MQVLQPRTHKLTFLFEDVIMLARGSVMQNSSFLGFLSVNFDYAESCSGMTQHHFKKKYDYEGCQVSRFHMSGVRINYSIVFVIK